MNRLVFNSDSYDASPFRRESELERAVVANQARVFGHKRIYLDIKRKIGKKGGRIGIPDGFLFDFTRLGDPRLYLVEIELATHDPYTDIGAQIERFHNAYHSDKQKVTAILKSALEKDPITLARVESLLSVTGCHNIDQLLSTLVHDKEFAIVVIIDELLEELRLLLENRSYTIEKMEFRAYKNAEGQFAYAFDPFLFDVEETLRETGGQSDEIADFDTVIVPAHEDGFNKVFIGEQRWWKLRISESMIPQIKYIAVYRVAPVSAITHWAPVKTIQPWRGTDKYVVNFGEPAKKIGAKKLVKDGKVKQFQNIRYANFSKLIKASDLDSVFY